MRIPTLVGRRVLIALVCIATTAPPALAQNGSVAGTVVDGASKRPVSGAQVFIKGTNIGTSTGEAGRYIISNVPPGQHTVGVRQLGYAAQERPVTVAAGQRASLDFELTSQAISLSEVVVTGTATATEVRKIGNSVASVNVAELAEKAPILGVDQLIKGRTPGVIMNIGQSTVGTPGQIKIRGTKSIALPSDPVIYIDGVKINNSDDRPIFIGGQGINRLADLNPAEIDRVASQAGIAAVLGRTIGGLSKGYRQRVGLSQALLGDPEVLILDEPTVGLDPLQIREVRELVKSLAGLHTVVLSTHILAEVAMTCQKVLVVNRGRLVDYDTLDGLIARHLPGRRVTLEDLAFLEEIYAKLVEGPAAAGAALAAGAEG